MEWLANNPWIVWLVVAGGLAVTEMITLDLTLLMLGGGALAGGAVAFVAPELFWLQLLVGVVASVVLLFVLRPQLLRRLRSSPGYHNALDKVLGSAGYATSEITATGGTVKLGGEDWTARTADGVIPAGAPIEVLAVEGVIVVVRAHREPELPR